MYGSTKERHRCKQVIKSLTVTMTLMTEPDLKERPSINNSKAVGNTDVRAIRTNWCSFPGSSGGETFVTSSPSSESSSSPTLKNSGSASSSDDYPCPKARLICFQAYKTNLEK